MKIKKLDVKEGIFMLYGSDNYRRVSLMSCANFLISSKTRNIEVFPSVSGEDLKSLRELAKMSQRKVTKSKNVRVLKLVNKKQLNKR